MDASRTIALLGEQAVDRLKNSTVAIFGVGGVGSFAAEAIARAGVGTIVLVDNDVVKPSNCNRQLVALESTVGRRKTHVMRERILDINKDATVIAHDIFYDAQTSDRIFLRQHIDLSLIHISAKAACDLVEMAGAKVSSLNFVIELTDLGGREALKGYNVYSQVQY